jgi:hypothetical protein
VIPWPKLQIPAYNNELNNRLFFSTPHKDTYTQHRVDMISKIESLGIGVDIEFGLSSQLWEEKIRDYVGVLDIPKSNNWPWPSPMRTFRAISNGKLVYSSRIETNKLNGISSIFEIPIFDLKAQMLTLKQESSELQATYNFMYKRQNFEFISMLSEYIHSM